MLVSLLEYGPSLNTIRHHFIASYVYWDRGQLKKALKHMHEALAVADEVRWIASLSSNTHTSSSASLSALTAALTMTVLLSPWIGGMYLPTQVEIMPASDVSQIYSSIVEIHWMLGDRQYV
jgi:hypothetical protein